MSILDTFNSLSALPRKNGEAEAMDVLDRLHAEHELVKKLCGQLVDSESAPERTKLLVQIKKALVPHERAEEKAIYDRVGKMKEKEAKVESAEGYLEHGLGDSVVGKLSKITNKKSPEFTAAAKVLKELLEHHISEEENNIWPHMRENYSEDQLVQIDREYTALKKKVKVP